MPLPTPKFEEGKAWDGTTPHTRPSIDIFKAPDGEIGNRITAEIIAIEKLLKDVVTTIKLLENPDAANSVLGVKSDQSGFEYKTLVQGTGVTLTHIDGTIVFSIAGEISGIAGENLTIGDVLYISTDGKAYKAQADSKITSKVVGCSNRTANIDESISIISFGIMTNPGWALINNDTYYLSPDVAGALVSIPPSLIGQYLVLVGIAINSTQLAVNLQTRIRM